MLRSVRHGGGGGYVDRVAAVEERTWTPCPAASSRPPGELETLPPRPPPSLADRDPLDPRTHRKHFLSALDSGWFAWAGPANYWLEVSCGRSAVCVDPGTCRAQGGCALVTGARR